MKAPAVPRDKVWDRFAEPPLVDDPAGPYGWGWVFLVCARGDVEAHLIAGRLEAEGIETSTVKDRNVLGNFLWCGSNSMAPVTILVRRIQLEDARLVLAEIALESPVAPDPEPSGGWKSSALWWAAAVLLAIFFTVAAYVSGAERLEACRDQGRCRPAPAVAR